MNTTTKLTIEIPENVEEIVFDFTAEEEDAAALVNEEYRLNAAAIGYEVLRPEDMFELEQVPESDFFETLIKMCSGG